MNTTNDATTKTQDLTSTAENQITAPTPAETKPAKPRPAKKIAPTKAKDDTNASAPRKTESKPAPQTAATSIDKTKAPSTEAKESSASSPPAPQNLEKAQKTIDNSAQGSTATAEAKPSSSPVNPTSSSETSSVERKQGPRSHHRKNAHGHHQKKNPNQNANKSFAVPINPDLPTINICDLRKKPLKDLHEICRNHGVQNISRVSKQDLIFALLKSFAKLGHEIKTTGVLETMSEQNIGYGFLRSESGSFLAGADDVYVSPRHIKMMKLKSGDTVTGTVRPPKGDERYFALNQIQTINFEEPLQSIDKTLFKDLVAQFPTRWMNLSRNNSSTEDVTAKIIDMFSPLGYGQRMMIPAPPKAGKTVLLQQIADSISANHPDAELIVLLIDERPEEVTEMERTVNGTVIAATFDEPPARHIQVAEMVISKAKRLAEHNKDVVIMLDSITRLARAYNTVTPASGKILTGGVDANALQRPKRFFGAARDTTTAGSITIVATALIETGSKMDEVIYEEFKGTGNSEIHLARDLAQKGIFPAIDIQRSGTRRDDKIVPSENLANSWALKRYLQTMENGAGTEFLIERLKTVKTIGEFFKAMKSK